MSKFIRALVKVIVTLLTVNAMAIPSIALAEGETITQYEREELARMLYGEDRYADWSTESVIRKAAVVQVALNRLDAWGGELFDTDSSIVRKSQFHGYSRRNPVEPWAIQIVNAVCDGWQLEKKGELNPWRPIPCEYLYFASYRQANRFRKEFEPEIAAYWEFPEDISVEWEQFMEIYNEYETGSYEEHE